MALIAVSRCLYLTKPAIFDKLLGGKRAYLVVFSVWVYSNILLAPIYTKVRAIQSCQLQYCMYSVYTPFLQSLGHFGYLPRLQKCDMVPDNFIYTEVMTYGIAFPIPLFLTTVSCFIIWVYVLSAGKYLKTTGYDESLVLSNAINKYTTYNILVYFRFSNQLRRLLNQRDLRMTWTLIVVCVCYFIFVGPICITYIKDSTSENPNLNLALHMWYWVHYSINFTIYAARSEQFRKAYVYFLRRVC